MVSLTHLELSLCGRASFQMSITSRLQTETVAFQATKTASQLEVLPFGNGTLPSGVTIAFRRFLIPKYVYQGCEETEI
jgi:hypothetical protein